MLHSVRYARGGRFAGIGMTSFAMLRKGRGLGGGCHLSHIDTIFDVFCKINLLYIKTFIHVTKSDW